MPKVKSPIELIKKGILEESWKDVISGYQMLTGDESLSEISDVIEEETKKKPKSSKSKTKTAKATKSKKPKFAIDDEEAIDRKILSKTKTPERKNWLVTGPVKMSGTKPFMPFNTQELIDEDEVKDNKKRLRKKIDVRDHYEPKIMTCNCGKKFDFNKAYPVGVLESNHSRIMCPQCQNNYRG